MLFTAARDAGLLPPTEKALSCLRVSSLPHSGQVCVLLASDIGSRRSKLSSHS
ncbi:MAG TPA: hypothetical protein VK879_09605 [Candidatus Sulfomarinibacteraceae bacterium]|nr:hypothetical protein [Candidatus Sulfomarinibacteraceae bacterium]